MIVEHPKLFQGLGQFLDGAESSDPEQLINQGSEEAFDATVTFGVTHRGQRRFGLRSYARGAEFDFIRIVAVQF